MAVDQWPLTEATQVTHIAASDAVGGAAIASFRLHQGLKKVGVDSEMIVGLKVTNDPDVHAVQRPRSLLARAKRRMQHELQDRRYCATPRLGYEFFSSPSAIGGADVLKHLPGGRLLNIHWVAGFLDFSRFRQWHRVDGPVVLTLHDMNPFTGGCHYTVGCEKFTDCCGACPGLGSTKERDLSALGFRIKQNTYDALEPGLVQVVATSRWMSKEAARSALLRRFDVVTIPNGLDTDAFAPRNRELAREVLGLPREIKLVMFAAQSIENYRKGLDLLLGALQGIAVPGAVGLLSVGGGQLRWPLDHRHFALGEIKSERLLSLAYSAADVFVTPARQEAFGQVVVESMACGTPVVGFDVGGIPDMVRTGVTGLLAPAENVQALKEAIEALLTNDDLRSRLSKRCREVALEDYSLEQQARRYKEVYTGLSERRTAFRAERRGGAE